MHLLEAIHLLTFPLVGAAIGWFTNFLAIKMLFHPREPIRLPGMRLQGLLPRRRLDLADRIGETVAAEILSAREISSLLGKIHWREEVQGIVHSVITRDLIPRRMQFLPGVSVILDQIQVRLTDRILEALAEHMDGIVTRFHDELDLKKMVVDKMSGLDLDEIETLVFRLAGSELRHIELVGAILGFAVGLVQSLLFFHLSRP
jgi:uncharacterized membrane protein YheB (UPF0754 family)